MPAVVRAPGIRHTRQPAEAYWRQALAIFAELDVPDAEEVKALLAGDLPGRPALP